MDLSAPAFSLDGTPVSMGEVLVVGEISGLLDAQVELHIASLSVELFAEHAGFELDRAQIQAGVNSWRKTNDQISADQTRLWLERHNLELDDLVAHVNRRLLLQSAAPERVERAKAECVPTGSQVAETLVASIAFGGHLESLVNDVARRAAANPVDDPVAMNEATRTLTAGRTRSWFALPADAHARAAAIEARFTIHRDQLLTHDARIKALSRDRQALSRVEFVQAQFSDEAVAREAICCMREDGEWLEVLGDNLGFETVRQTSFVEDLDDGAIPALLASAPVGEAIGPTFEGGAWIVLEILSRIVPDLAVPEVKRRIDARIVRRGLAPALERRVRMHYGVQL